MSAPAHALLEDFSTYRATDVNCHIGGWPYRLGASASEHDLQRHIDLHGLSSAWVSHLATLFGFDTRTGNEDCLLKCRHTPAMRPMAVINPAEEGWHNELDWATTMGFQGIRVAPGFHRYGPDLLLDVARATASRGLLLQLLVRLDDARVRHPQSPARDVDMETVVALVRSVPDARVLLSGLNWVEWQELRRRLGYEPPSTLLVDVWHMNGPFGIAELLGSDAERWVFGSGFPVQAPEPTMLQLAACLLPREIKVSIARGNAQRFSADPHRPVPGRLGLGKEG